MATPVGHSLLGLTMLYVLSKEKDLGALRWYALSVFAANAADLDFIPGLIVGDTNAYHQMGSHSIFAALLFGVIVVLLAFKSQVLKLRIFLISASCYATHLLLDYFVRDSREPIGIPLAWPFFDAHWTSPVSIFYGVKHGVPGDSASEFFTQVFSLQNVFAIGREVSFVLPIFLLVMVIKYKRRH